MLNREPTAIIGFIRIAIMALVLFGVPLTVEKQAVLLALAEAGLTLWNRSAVTPVSGGKPPTGGAAVGLIALLLLFVGCSSVTATDRAKTADLALDALAAICPSYATGKSGIPETPELDAVCAALLREPVVVVPIVESRDGGP